MAAAAPSLACPVKELPCTYLGLPLSLSKLHKRDLQLVIDKLAGKLAHWKARLMSKEGRVAYVQFVMTASVVYHLLALDLDPWFLKAVDKLRKAFLLAGSDESPGGKCMVAWNLVSTSPPLRIQSRCSMPPLPSQCAPEPFWADPWIGGLTTHAITPAVVALVKPRFLRRRTVREGLLGQAWVLDIAGELSIDATVQFLRLWEAVARVPVGGGDDGFRWKWTADGTFSSRTAYQLLFEGTTALPGATHIWNSIAPMKFRLHAWLALRRCCWTADRLLEHGLPANAMCQLCSAADETLDHLSLLCPFAVEVWTRVTLKIRL
ncbi:hypothetical protein ACQ4PT_034225 [Festuca glaucescens]